MSLDTLHSSYHFISYHDIENLHSSKRPERKYPGSQLNLLPVLEIKDTPFIDNFENPTTVTFTPITRVPPHHIHHLQPFAVGYSQQGCNEGVSTSQNNLATVDPSTEFQAQHRCDHSQVIEERGTTYRLNTTATDNTLIHQCSNDNSI